MKHTFKVILAASLLVPLAVPISFQGLETVQLQSSKPWN